MDQFSVKRRKTRLGKKVTVLAKLKSDERNMDFPRNKSFINILNILQDFWALGNTGAFERLEDRMKQILEKENEIWNIYCQLNGPYHGDFSEEQEKALIEREKELRAELTL